MQEKQCKTRQISTPFQIQNGPTTRPGWEGPSAPLSVSPPPSMRHRSFRDRDITAARPDLRALPPNSTETYVSQSQPGRSVSNIAARTFGKLNGLMVNINRTSSQSQRQPSTHSPAVSSAGIRSVSTTGKHKHAQAIFQRKPPKSHAKQRQHCLSRSCYLCMCSLSIRYRSPSPHPEHSHGNAPSSLL